MTDLIFEEKRNQDYIYSQKVEPKYRNTFQKLLVSYDLEHSPLQIIKNNCKNYEKMILELKNLISQREIFLTKIVSEINI